MSPKEKLSNGGIECGICWRAEHLSEAQRNDPANAVTGTIRMCPKHQQAHDDLWARFGDSIFILPREETQP